MMSQVNYCQIIELLADDDVLMDIATTCSNRGVALTAEMHLRRRYPSKRSAKTEFLERNKAERIALESLK